MVGAFNGHAAVLHAEAAEQQNHAARTLQFGWRAHAHVGLHAAAPDHGSGQDYLSRSQLRRPRRRESAQPRRRSTPVTRRDATRRESSAASIANMY